MKTIKFFIIVTAMLVSIASCKKEPGFEGKKEIFGTVNVGGTAVEGAIVYIAFDTDVATETYSSSTTTDATGNYRFYALAKGSYFVDAKYTNDKGANFYTDGSIVEIGKKKGEVQADLTLN